MQYNQENSMFDMRETGARISALRRAAGLTQAELAEKLGISYQAVSSWERGASMPDIGKLVDLARALNTTVDHILSGGKAEAAPDPPQEAEAEAPAADAAPAEEDEEKERPKGTVFSFTLPGLEGLKKVKERITVKRTGSGHRADGLSSLIALAPFLDQETLDQKALELDAVNDLALLSGLAPFLSSATLEKLVLREDGAPVSMSALSCLAPFLSTDTLDRLAENCDPGQDMKLITGLAPFLSQEALTKLFTRSQQALKREPEEQQAAAPQAAAPLSERNIDTLIEGIGSEDVPDIARRLLPQLTDKQMAQLAENCDSEDVPELAQALEGQLTENLMQRLIEACDSDCLEELVEALSSHLDSAQAGRIIRRMGEED